MGILELMDVMGVKKVTCGFCGKPFTPDHWMTDPDCPGRTRVADEALEDRGVSQSALDEAIDGGNE